MSETFKKYEHRRKMTDPLPSNNSVDIPPMRTTYLDPEVYKLFFDPLQIDLTTEQGRGLAEIEQGLIRRYFLSSCSAMAVV